MRSKGLLRFTKFKHDNNAAAKIVLFDICDILHVTKAPAIIVFAGACILWRQVNHRWPMFTKWCLYSDSTSWHFGQNCAWRHPCQIQKTPFWKIIGPEIGQASRSPRFYGIAEYEARWYTNSKGMGGIVLVVRSPMRRLFSQANGLLIRLPWHSCRWVVVKNRSQKKGCGEKNSRNHRREGKSTTFLLFLSTARLNSV